MAQAFRLRRPFRPISGARKELPLLLTSAQCADLLEHARSAAPEECCGILIGLRRGTELIVSEVQRAANVWAGSRLDRYELDPRAQLRAQRESREKGCEIVAFYHSHPAGAAIPSQFDAQLAWPDQAYVILSPLARSDEQIRCWRFNEAGEWTEESVLIGSG